MSSTPLDQALERAERALLRIERSAGERRAPRDNALRERVAEVVAELDDMLREARR